MAWPSCPFLVQTALRQGALLQIAGERIRSFLFVGEVIFPPSEGWDNLVGGSISGCLE